jgi:hypothetical protein
LVFTTAAPALRAANILFSRRDTDSTLNKFIRLSACARAQTRAKSNSARPLATQYVAETNYCAPILSVRQLLISVIAVAVALSLLAVPLTAQRVEFPTPVQPANPYPPPPTYVAPATPYGAAPPSTFTSPPTYAPQAVGPPPAFDPYASGSSVGAPPPVAAPYSYTPPAAPYTQQPPALVPNSQPMQFQPPPYDITTSGEGYWAKTQRLLQEISAEYTFIYGKHSSPFALEINRVELSSTFAFPMFYNIETPLLVTPGFAFNFLDGPITGPPLPGPPVTAGGPDLPPIVYDAYLDFAWYPHCYQWLGGELGFRTGVWSDFHHVDSDSVRLLGRALASVALSPTLDVRFGVVYLDRVDVKILPAGGVYWRPTPDWDLYLVFPNPKARKFLTAIGNTKWYGYAAGEYGGGSWTVRRQVEDDQFDYNDIRVIGGLEWETQTLVRGHIELGYVFDRNLVFKSNDPPEFSLNDTIMLRAGINF